MFKVFKGRININDKKINIKMKSLRFYLIFLKLG